MRIKFNHATPQPASQARPSLLLSSRVRHFHTAPTDPSNNLHYLPSHLLSPYLMSDKVTRFLSGHEEKLKLNQFWYSAPTIATMVNEIEQYATRCAFLSTPSLFFSLNSTQLQNNSTLFDVRQTATRLPSEQNTIAGGSAKSGD